MSEALTLIGIVVGSAAFGIVFAEFAFMHVNNWQVKKKYWVTKEVLYGKTPIHDPIITYRPRRLKPFDCHLCMSFWVCLLVCHFYQDLDIITSCLTSCCSAVFSVWVWKQIRP